MSLHKASVSQWWSYASTLVYSTLSPLLTPPQQCNTQGNINLGWCSVIGDVKHITVLCYFPIHGPICTVTVSNTLNGPKLMILDSFNPKPLFLTFPQFKLWSQQPAIPIQSTISIVSSIEWSTCRLEIPPDNKDFSGCPTVEKAALVWQWGHWSIGLAACTHAKMVGGSYRI